MSEPYNYKVIGLMSGTSLDGLDIVYAEFHKEQDNWTYAILDSASIEYDEGWRNELTNAIRFTQVELEALHARYGSWLGKQVKSFIAEGQLKVDLIASHGHTIFHEPDKGITRQIGDGQTIANITGVQTICDFRSQDVKLGGQGAPLVPIGDKLLFSEKMACLNLGGIANISYDNDGRRIAYDIGMANIPLNHFARELGYEYDKEGIIASKGEVNRVLCEELNKLQYFHRSPPKSLGIEWFHNKMAPVVDAYEISVEDKLASLVKHQAFQIGKAINRIGHQGKVLLTGGGAYNLHFVQTINDYLEPGKILEIPSKQLVEFKEALIFAFMGTLRLRKEVNCLKSVTGAKKDSCAGEVYSPHVS